MTSTTQTTISPIDGSAVAKRQLATDAELGEVVKRAGKAFGTWRKTTLKHRLDIMHKFLDAFEAETEGLGKELTEQMGRPIRYGAGEINGFLERGRHMCSIAEKSLADVPLTETDKPGFRRYIRREALGVVLIISAWNFPYLIQANSIFPALLAGNTVLLKPSPQTPSPAERIASLLSASGLPSDVCQVMHTTPDQLDTLVASPLIAHVSFTGSVANGRRVEAAAARGGNFKSTGLELGGKDAAYVREDADPKWAAEEIADGAFFNAGQSCCAIERVYVHERVYDDFVGKLVEVVSAHKLGDPREKETTLGPVVSQASAKLIRSHIADAVQQGAKALIEERNFTAAKEGTTYVAPQVLINVDHKMRVMSEETFGPVVGVMKVASDEEALGLINDSVFGLTASVWTNDEEAFARLEGDIDVGTLFMNRCDYLDPALAWTAVKDSGRGVSLSKFGFDALTRPKSIHLKSVK